jgi:hypothetical protein
MDHEGAAEEGRGRKKERRTHEDAVRRIEARERYRALVDVVKEGFDLVDIWDTRVRFALIIMGAINTGLAILATRTGVLHLVEGAFRNFLYAYLVVLLGIALYFFLLATEALRPRNPTPAVEEALFDPLHKPLGLRNPWAVRARDFPGYCQAWREARIGQINAELMQTAYGLAHVNIEKYHLVKRLYAGLRLQILLWAALMTVVVGARIAAAL